jgi:hypothetical protein
MDLEELGLMGVDCVDLTQGEDHWWILVNMVLTSGFHEGGVFPAE